MDRCRRQSTAESLASAPAWPGEDTLTSRIEGILYGDGEVGSFLTPAPGWRRVEMEAPEVEGTGREDEGAGGAGGAPQRK